MTDFDVLEAFGEVFDTELVQDSEKSGVPVSEFKAGGRASKAFPNKEDATWWRAYGPGMVQNWIDFRKNLPNWHVWTTPSGEPGIELELRATIKTVPVRAYLDRVMVDTNTGELSIVDLKTGSRTPESDLQLGFYRVLLQKTMDVDARIGYYWMARKGELQPAVDLSRFDEGLIGALLEDFERAVQANIFIPHMNSMCGSCGVNRACAVYGGAEAHLYDPMHPNYTPDIKESK